MYIRFSIGLIEIVQALSAVTKNVWVRGQSEDLKQKEGPSSNIETQRTKDDGWRWWRITVQTRQTKVWSGDLNDLWCMRTIGYSYGIGIRYTTSVCGVAKGLCVSITTVSATTARSKLFICRIAHAITAHYPPFVCV